MVLIAGVFLNQNAILKQLNLKTEKQAADLAALNRTLEARVNEQVGELDRIGQLKRFLSPEVVSLVVAQGDKSLLESHRRYVTALFCDLRGFTSFSESTEPEEVMDMLQQYHHQLGRLVSKYGGTIDHRAGDGIMVFFNDPLPCEHPIHQAVKLAFDAHDTIAHLLQRWGTSSDLESALPQVMQRWASSAMKVVATTPLSAMILIWLPDFAITPRMVRP